MTQLSEELTYKLFTKTELDYSNEIVINPNMLQFATLSKRKDIANTLSQITDLVTVNELREMFYLPPKEGGDKYANRKDRMVGDNNGN